MKETQMEKKLMKNLSKVGESNPQAFKLGIVVLLLSMAMNTYTLNLL